jgi:type III restriction enzyme
MCSLVQLWSVSALGAPKYLFRSFLKSIRQPTLLEIVRRIENKQAILDNPYEFAVAAVRTIKDKLADHLVHGIRYEKINEWFEMAQLEDEVESFQEYLVPASHSVYDHVLCDSDIERKFVEGLEKHDEVKLYLKLPGWFKVSTPGPCQSRGGSAPMSASARGTDAP